MLARFERYVAREIERQGGRHDETAIYDGEPGDPGLCGPGSMSWEIHGDLASLVIGGPGAILMEVLHPSVMHGVATQSGYRTEPLRRARNTLCYVLRTTFGSTPGATRVVEMVKRAHANVRGTRADGVSYRALDPELLGWVHTCIPWAVMSAYDRYGRRLSVAEKNRYLREQAVIGRMGGAGDIPETVAELETYVDRMRPHLAMNEQTMDLLSFLDGRTDTTIGAAERASRRVGVCASMLLMPEWAQRLTSTHEPSPVRRALLRASDHAQAAVIRRAYAELPCKVMATRRAGGTPSPRADVERESRA